MSGQSAAVALVAHQGAEVTVVILELLLEEGDGGRSIEDDPRLGGRRALAAAVRPTHGGDVGGSEQKGKEEQLNKTSDRSNVFPLFRFSCGKLTYFTVTCSNNFANMAMTVRMRRADRA